MSRVLMLALALLCSAAWLQAQNQYPQNPPTGSSPSGSSQTAPTGSGQEGSAASQTGTSSNQTSIEGCLQGSNGTFTLTDKSGMTYQLQGDSSKLSKHVGHEVELTGSASSAGSTAGAGSTTGAGSSSASSTGGTSQGSSQMFTVDKVKHKSDTCTNTSK